MILNYPNNPTGAVIEDRGFFDKAVSFAKKYNIHMLMHYEQTENAYLAIAREKALKKG